MRRHVEIFRKFGEQTGYPHPHMQKAIANYSGLLRALGRSETEIETARRDAVQ